MPTYAWSIPVMFIGGLLGGRFALHVSWVIAIIDGIILTALFNAAYWFSDSRSRNRRSGAQ